MSSGPDRPVTLVTGALGCLGAWTLRHLVSEGADAVSFDASTDRRRLDLVMNRGEQNKVTFVQGDLTEFSTVLDTIQKHRITHVVHLAALQIPFCKADPVLGATVNVVGTVNVLEAARQAGLRHVAYASSIAAHADDSTRAPSTLYGAYKQANEHTAHVYWQDHGLSSIGLRPYTVYGVGRDQGLTSEPTMAMLASAANTPYRISFGGRMQFHYASDVARRFIEAANTPIAGARVFDLGTEPVAIAEVVEIILRLRPASAISHVEEPLPFPDGVDAGALARTLPSTQDTPIEQGIRETIDRFGALLAEGALRPPGEGS